MNILNPYKINNPLAPNLSPNTAAEGTAKFGSIIQTIIAWLLIIAILLFFFHFLIGAIRWISSGGDKNSVESARGTIMQAVAGIFIVFAMFAIIKIIEGMFGVCILNFTLPGIDDVVTSKSCIPQVPADNPGLTNPWKL